MKKVFTFILMTIIIASAILMLGCLKQTLPYDTELVVNSNLESKSTGWTYYTDDSAKVNYTEKVLTAGSTEYEKDSRLHGSNYIGIDSKSAGSYGYFSQEIALDKNATYLLSCDVKVTSKVSSDGSIGAFVGLAESSVISQSLTAVGDWQTIQVCFRNNSYDTVNVRFGMGTDNSNVSDGYAYFDNISLKKISDPDTQAVGLLIYDLGTKGASGFSASYLTAPEGIIFTVLLVVLGTAVLVVAYFVYRFYKGKKVSENTDIDVVTLSSKERAKRFFTSSAFLITVSAIITFAVRLVLTMTLYGHGAAINKEMLSAEGFAKDGIISHYYNSSTYYTPGVSYVLWIMGLLSKSFNLLTGSMGMAIFIKIPAIVADLVLMFVLYIFANKYYGSVKAFIIATAYALVPAIFIASSVYGSYISIGILFLVLTLINAREKKIVPLTVFYTLSVFFMAESLWVLPILLVYAVIVYVKNPDKRIVLPVSATVSIVASYLLTLPLSFNFFAGGKPFIVLERYCTIFSTNKLFTDGAFNVYAMCGQSGLNVNTAGVVMSAILASIGMLYCIFIYLKTRDRQQLVLLVGYTMLFIFTFAVRMTPFISIIGLTVLFLYTLMSGDRDVLLTTSALSIIATLSMCYELMICKYVPGGSNAQEITMSSADPVAIVFSIVWVALTIYMGYLVWRTCINNKYRRVDAISEGFCDYVKNLFGKKEKLTVDDQSDGDKNAD